MRRRILVIAAAMTATLTAAFTGALPASADGLSLPIDTVIEAAPGSVIELGRISLDVELAGPDCTWTATASNQESAHVGNDIIISSGGEELVLAGVEDTVGKITTSTGSAYLVEEIVVSLRMGPDGVFSAGIDLTIVYDEGCQPVPSGPTTTEAVSTTTETTTETTTDTTTDVEEVPETPSTTPTTAPPPAPPTTVSATEPVLPVTGSRWVSILAMVGAALIATGIVATRRASDLRP